MEQKKMKVMEVQGNCSFLLLWLQWSFPILQKQGF